MRNSCIVFVLSPKKTWKAFFRWNFLKRFSRQRECSLGNHVTMIPPKVRKTLKYRKLFNSFFPEKKILDTQKVFHQTCRNSTVQKFRENSFNFRKTYRDYLFVQSLLFLTRFTLHEGSGWSLLSTERLKLSLKSWIKS